MKSISISLLSFAIILDQFSIGKCADCPIEDTDAYTLIPLLQDAVLNDSKTLINLAGVFFSDQKKPPYSVQVNYTVCIPDNQDCRSQCSCWNDVCTNDTGVCPEGHCAANYLMIWGSMPQVASDEVYRSLVTCPFVVGGIREKSINIHLNLTKDGLEIPCNWCQKEIDVGGYFFRFPTVIDDTFLVMLKGSPIETALETITAKLRGYGARLHALSWLRYSSDIAFGYAARHYSNSHPLVWNRSTFALAYFMLNIVMFMLMYKYRYRLYHRVYHYVSRDRMSSSLVWSFIFTSIISSIIVIFISFFSDGWCMTIYQIILLVISLFFCLLHLSITVFKLRKTHVFPVMLAHAICIRYAAINKAIQIVMFFFFYSIPHVASYIIVLFFVNFLYNPFGYLILLIYFAVSFTITWIANALSLYLLTPNCFACLSLKNRKARRHALFAFVVAGAFNCLNASLSIFVSVYFYDIRGASTSYLTIIPGLIISFLGWYISGDLSKLFNFVSIDKVSKEDPAKKPSKEDKEEKEREVEEATHNLAQVRAKGGNKHAKKLKRLANAVRLSVSSFYEDSSDDHDENIPIELDIHSGDYTNLN